MSSEQKLDADAVAKLVDVVLFAVIAAASRLRHAVHRKPLRGRFLGV